MLERVNKWKTVDGFWEKFLLKGFYPTSKIFDSPNAFIAFTWHFLSLKKGYTYSTNFTFQTKAQSSVITMDLHPWKLPLEILVSNSNISVFSLESSLIIRGKQIVNKKKGFIRDNLSEKLHYFPKSIILIDTRQKNLLILMTFASINIKYSSTIGTTFSSSDDSDSITGNWQPYSTRLYSKTCLVYNIETNAWE